jgi:hypothetical protein
MLGGGGVEVGVVIACRKIINLDGVRSTGCMPGSMS